MVRISCARLGQSWVCSVPGIKLHRLLIGKGSYYGVVETRFVGCGVIVAVLQSLKE